LLLSLGGCVQAPTKAPPFRFVDTGVGDTPAMKSHRAKVDYTIEDEPLEPGETAIGRVEFIEPKADPANAPPVYPARLQAKRLPPTTISVRLSIEADGAVFGVEPLGTMTTTDQRALIEAVRDACWSWKYSPMIRLELDRGETFTVDRDGSSLKYEGHPTPLPFHLDYAFKFSLQDGHAAVEMQQLGPPSQAPGES
jgi:hypothetical protein